MNEDGYPRVTRDGAWTGSSAVLRDLPDGAYKIVPAEAIVIERADVPEVIRRTDRYVSCGGALYVLHDRAEEHWDVAVEQVALAEYRREHPPVPEPSQRDIDFLTGRIVDGDSGNLSLAGCSRLARRLLATGKVHVDVEEAEK